MIKNAIEKYQQEKGKKIQLKAVLFDMDGVLFDSMPNHTKAWHQTMTELGFHCSRDEFYLFEGATSSYTINRYYHRVHGRNVSEEERKTIYHRKTLHFNALPIADPMPYALEVLNSVKAAGLIPVLVTGSGQKSLLDRLNKHFPGIFEQELMVTAYDVHQGKPHP
ncbi:MAG: HAD hydrolase-like protein, partial [Bacteroidota bacterium]|nr:HAD hydrolase-like protein [Bacteroidota bacterium]